MIYSTRSFIPPLSGPILDSRSIHTHVRLYGRTVKFYGSGCLERFLDYTHLKKIPHESLQRGARVYTWAAFLGREAQTSLISRPALNHYRMSSTGRGFFPSSCARAAAEARRRDDPFISTWPLTRNDTPGIIRLIIFRRHPLSCHSSTATSPYRPTVVSI